MQENLKEENFEPLLPFIKDPLITDINYNGTDVWLEHTKKGRCKADIQLTAEFLQQFIAQVPKKLLNNNNFLQTETGTLRINIIHLEPRNEALCIAIRKMQMICKK